MNAILCLVKKWAFLPYRVLKPTPDEDEGKKDDPKETP